MNQCCGNEDRRAGENRVGPHLTHTLDGIGDEYAVWKAGCV